MLTRAGAPLGTLHSSVRSRPAFGFAVDGWYLIIGSLVRGYTG